MPDFEKDYWDLAKPPAAQFESTYTDWEGFASVDEIQEQLQFLKDMVERQAQEDKEYHIFCADLTLHWVYENVDQAGYTPTVSETGDVFWAFVSTLNTRHIMKSYQFGGDNG